LTEDAQGFRLGIRVTRINPYKATKRQSREVTVGKKEQAAVLANRVVGVGVVRVKIYATKCDRENPG
jgi:hypothetical protein